VKTLTVTYASTHVIDEIGLWQLETKSRVPEQKQGGGGEGVRVWRRGGGSGNDGSNIPSLVIGRVHKLVQGSFFDDLIITRI
jgi:hypothetical protein